MRADAGQVSSRQILQLFALTFSLPFLFQEPFREIGLNENQGFIHLTVTFANGNTDLPIFEDIGMTYGLCSATDIVASTFPVNSGVR